MEYVVIPIANITILIPYSLPGLTNRLVSEVIAANPNTIVINQSGTPVEMPWIGDAHTLLQVGSHSNSASSCAE